MKSVLVIDDSWKSNKDDFLRSPDLKGIKVVGFSDSGEAIKYLRTIDAKDYPDTCIVDVISIPSVPQSNFGIAMLMAYSQPVGVNTAISLERFFSDNNHRNVKYVFKSADRNKADTAKDEFLRLRQDYFVGTMSQNARALFVFDKEEYTPPSIPEFAKDFLYQASRLHPMDVFDKLRGEPIQNLHAIWDDLGDVQGAENATYIEFEEGFGSPKSGKVVRTLNDIKSLPHNQKGIFIGDTIPDGFLAYARNLSAIVITDTNDFAGHLRLLLKPLEISILCGADLAAGLEITSDEVTVHPVAKKLYLKKLGIVDMSKTIGRADDYIDEMNEVAKERVRRSSLNLPHFRVNISGLNDHKGIFFAGLTRTEHFLSPYVAPSAFESLRDFLIGEDAVKLRKIFRIAGGKYNDLPYIAQKKIDYDNQYRLVVRLPMCVSSYESEDVLRLLDIPVDEFFDEEERKKFEELYGKNTRGVQLAKQVPDLYINQLRMLMGFGRFHSEGMPLILVPAVQSAEDIDFVRECVTKSLPPKLCQGLRLAAMIDSKIACENIEEIARNVSHISIGSNDLTADILKISRQNPDEAYKFMSLPKELIPVLKEIVRRARESNPYITISLCGGAAADVDSLMALKTEGVWLDYFSVPPTYKDTRLLPLVYKDMMLADFCGPLEEPDGNFWLESRGMKLN